MYLEEIGGEHDLKIRQCARRDVENIQQILVEAPEAAAWSAAAVDEALNCDERLFLVADIEAELAGFAVARLITDEAEILNFAVKRAYRRCGVGRRLLEKLFRQLRELGATKVFLEVRESNAAAIAFYRKLGFESVGRRPSYYQQPDEAAIIMQAELRRNLPPHSPNSVLS